MPIFIEFWFHFLSDNLVLCVFLYLLIINYRDTFKENFKQNKEIPSRIKE